MTFTGKSYAQGISIIWDSETGCLVYDEKDQRYEPLEEVEDGDCVRVCENSTVTYSLTGDNTSWTSTDWTVAGGTIISTSLTECVVKWGPAGWSTVTASITKNDGTVHEEEICVEVILSPKALFGLMPDISSQYAEACEKESLYFVNLSDTNDGAALMSYHWDFGDGTTSSEFEPTHVYYSPGVYTVVLEVTNTCNCTDYYKMEIKVKPGGFEIECPSVVCEGDQATYSVPDYIADACGNHNQWSVIGGTIVSNPPYSNSIEVNWDNVGPEGVGFVTYDTSGCDVECASAVTIQIPVIKNEGSITGDDTICVNSQSIYKLPQWPSTVFDWSIDANGTGATLVTSEHANQIIVETYGTTGTIKLSVTYYNTLLNCGGTAEATIEIKPEAEITGDLDLCNNTTGNYELSNSYVGAWQLTGPGGGVVATGSGNDFSHNFSVAGNYTLMANSYIFCKPSKVAIIVREAEDAPTAILGVDVSCPGVPQTYSVVNNVAGTQIAWEVVNGTIAGDNYGDEVDITFGPVGPYIVRAWRESDIQPNCPSAIIEKTVTLPIVNLNITSPDPNPICSSTYGDYSVDYTDGEVYSWSVVPEEAGSVKSGNGTTDVSILWNEYTAAGGAANVMVTVTKCGIQHTQLFPVTVITSPTISLGGLPSGICEGENLTINLSSVPGLTSGTITWDFGDGTVVTTDQTMPGWLSVDHIYNLSGNSQVGFDIVVTLNDGNGCVNPAIETHSIVVSPAPVASISPAGNYSICPMSAQTLTVNVQGGLAAVTNIEWFQGAASVGSGPAMTSYTATTYGSYYAIVTGTNGCTTTTNFVSFDGDCGPPPCTSSEVVQITSAVNNCGTITVNGTYTGTPSSVTWNTNAPTISQSTTSNTGTFTFEESGSYTIFYKAIYGTCAVTDSYTIVVPYLPELKYTVTCGPSNNYEVTLLDNSNYYPGHNITDHTYHVNATNYPEGLATSKTVYLSPGTHTIGLTIDGPTGSPCSVAPITLDLPALPVATFSHNGPRCQNAAFEFIPDDMQPGLSYSWDFGDGTSNLQQSPSKVYTTIGLEDVTLTITNQFGCQVSHTEYNISIKENGLNGSINASALTVCDGSTITLSFINTGTGPAPSIYEWSRNNVVVGTGTTFTATESGSYSLHVETVAGCIFDIPAPYVALNFIKAPVAYISGSDEACLNEPFELTTNLGSDDVSYTWTLDGNPLTAFDDQNSIEQTLNTLGAHVYTVTASIPDGNGGFCTNTDTHTVTVNPNPSNPNITMSVVDCDSYSVELTATATGAGTFTWSNGDSGSTITVNQGGAYQVRFTNTSGCTSTRSIMVPKDPAVYFWTVPVGCYEICKDLFQFSSITGPTISFPYWGWLQNGGTVDSGTYSTVTPLDLGVHGDGVYQLELDNGYCIKKSGEVDIKAIDCRECEIRVKIRKVYQIDEFGYCSYKIVFDVNNGMGAPIQLSPTAPNGEGMFIPSSFTAYPGNNTYTMDMVALNGYTGGSNISVLFEGIINGKKCITKVNIEIPECRNNNRMAMADTDITMKSSLILSPNPANEVVQLRYNYAGSVDGDTRTLEVYNLMGVLLETYSPKDANGSWSAGLERFSAGQYIVVMKLNGSVVTQQALIVK